MKTYDSGLPEHELGGMAGDLPPSPVRISRLLHLISVMQARSPIEGHDLPVLAGVSRRTFFRDLQLLRDAGVPVEYSRRGRTYTIAADYFLRPINLDAEETEALALAFVLLESQQAHPWIEPLRRAEAKIAAVLKREHEQRWNDVLRNVDVIPPPASPSGPIADIFSRVHEAINKHQVLRAEVDLMDGDQKSLTLRPMCVALLQVRWHVLTHVEELDAVRLIALDRIVHLASTDDSFRPPASASVHEYLGNAWRTERDATEHLVEIRFDPQIGEEIEMVNWHATQETAWLDDGSLLFRARVAGLSEIAHWILGYGPLARVVQPGELRDRVRALAEGTSALYEPDEANHQS